MYIVYSIENLEYIYIIFMGLFYKFFDNIVCIMVVV